MTNAGQRRPDGALAGRARADPRRRAAERRLDVVQRGRHGGRRSRRSSTTRRAPPGWRRGSCTPTATSSAHEEFVYCHDVRDGELFHGMGEWAWAAGIAPLLGPWRYGAVQAVYQREGGFDPHKQLAFLSRHGVTNVFGTPTAIRSMMSITDAGTRYPAEVPDRLLGRRAAEPRGDPLVPRAVRGHRARLLRPDRVLSAVRQLPVHGGPRGLDGQADAGLGGGDPRRGRAPGRSPASGARSACAPAPIRTTRWATGTGRRRTPRRCSAATGSTPRTPPRPTRTATTGTRAGPTT